MPNHLINETSPYLLQHAQNPVDWYPWGSEAFDRAREEDKPVFLSIGYSTCHWCHVMARESFEDREVADVLNRHFVCIKVDREERPDVDSIYLSVCQAFTGGGGWPASIFMTADQKPFFAGTYSPKTARYGAVGFLELLTAIDHAWREDRQTLLRSAEGIIDSLKQRAHPTALPDEKLFKTALQQFQNSYDAVYGGFGAAPKFPSAHNLLFLLTCHEKRGDRQALEMAERTLLRMYAGGLFDHIGYGFCRYSTDRYFLVPHFEKMLYDNALLILACCKAYERTKTPLYREIGEKTAAYILREMTGEGGGFFSAQDADSEGEEGKYYLFEPEEITELLGERDGAAFNRYYGIEKGGNFQGKSIPNLLKDSAFSDALAPFLPKVLAYRKGRTALNTDDKILTSWNGLMIAALCALYRVSGNAAYLDAADRARGFIEGTLWDQGVLYGSFSGGKRGNRGFLDDYAYFTFALLALYHATLDGVYLERAYALALEAVADFFDGENGGFYLYGKKHEALILRPKESRDGAMPSGNSIMTDNLIRLCYLKRDGELEAVLQKQLNFMRAEAAEYPSGYAMFLTALSDHLDPPETVTAVAALPEDLRKLPFQLPLNGMALVLPAPTQAYPIKDGRPTYYVCRGKSCLPPTNKYPPPDQQAEKPNKQSRP